MGMAPTRRAALPLGLLALTFFLPMADACNEVVSPFSYIRTANFGAALWLAPTFATAAILAAAVWRSWHGQTRTSAAFLATTALVITLPVLSVLFIHDSGWLQGALYAGAALGSWRLLWRARRAEGAERLSALLDTYLVAVLPLAITIASLARYFGAHLFLAAYGTLAAQRLLALLQRARSKRRGATMPVRIRVAAEIPPDLSSQRRVEEELARFDEALDEYVARRATSTLGP